jgi:uncharacterized protein with NRDE domain
MCTIIVRHRMDDWCSTVIASNRDEFYDRPASGPMVLNREPLILGGRDEREGGTWFGLTGDGVFAGLTNQRSFGTRDDSLRSRGELVVEALEAGQLHAVKRYLRRLDPIEFNEFNLIFGDGEQVCVAYGRRGLQEVEIQMLGPGVHVLCNDRLGSPEFPKADAVRSRVLSIPAGPWSRVQAQLVELLSDRSLPDPSDVPPLPPGTPFDQELARRLQAICVETPAYGTVSSTIAAVSPGRVEQYQFSAGPPSEGGFQDMIHLMRDAR